MSEAVSAASLILSRPLPEPLEVLTTRYGQSIAIYDRTFPFDEPHLLISNLDDPDPHVQIFFLSLLRALDSPLPSPDPEVLADPLIFRTGDGANPLFLDPATLAHFGRLLDPNATYVLASPETLRSNTITHTLAYLAQAARVLGSIENSLKVPARSALFRAMRTEVDLYRRILNTEGLSDPTIDFSLRCLKARLSPVDILELLAAAELSDASSPEPHPS